uniref:C2H2-type domain-containing protein n=1 Tax=Poecilia mexicana TaxID=48701 RepID=A0A3B3YZ89_9TELE
VLGVILVAGSPLTHTGEKPFACKLCDKSFINSSNLICHMRTHTGEKPFSCGTCGKAYRDRSNLVRHMRTHTGEKPYSCRVCGKSYSGSSQLAYHITTHTGEKPFSLKPAGVASTQLSVDSTVSTRICVQLLHMIYKRESLCRC